MLTVWADGETVRPVQVGRGVADPASQLIEIGQGPRVRIPAKEGDGVATTTGHIDVLTFRADDHDLRA